MRALLSRPITNPEVDMRFNLRRVGRNALLFLAAAAALASTTHGQDRAEGVFDVVPRQSRARLVERLGEYVRYERTGQYEKLYELLYEAGADNEKKLNKEAYAASREEAEDRRGVLQEFSPAYTLNITLNEGDPPTFVITGRARVFRDGQKVEKQMAVHARLQDGDWYFSEASDSYRHID
jgi:acetyl esterase/lipase